jgi:hypothetical protein
MDRGEISGKTHIRVAIWFQREHRFRAGDSW